MKISKPHPKITVYDDVFPWQEQHHLYLACRNAPYVIGWNDRVDSQEGYMHSEITPEMYEHLEQCDPTIQQFVKILFSSEPYNSMKDRRLVNTVINCDTMSDTHYGHTHQPQEVLLYYANTEWKDGWGGETFFFDKNGKDIIFASGYTPNRIIHFDGEILHNFGGPKREGPKFRFSISTFLWKND
jgi:hypothetical protein